MSKFNILSQKDIYIIQEEVKKIRTNFNGDIKKFVRDDENIILMYLPINSHNQNPSFSSVYLYLRKDDMKFIGVNSSDYYDNQLFAIAHELYHHYEKDDIHLSRISLDNEELSKREAKANRFAAELLLCEDDLKSEIHKINNYNIDMNECSIEKIYRLIAKLHCEYKLPYKTIVRRLKEIDAINEEKYNILYSINPRKEDSKYYKIGLGMDKDVFKKLNEITCEYGIEGTDLEDVLGNYEDGHIDITELIEDLAKFNKEISDFGYENEVYVDEESIEEFDCLFLEDEDE